MKQLTFSYSKCFILLIVLLALFQSVFSQSRGNYSFAAPKARFIEQFPNTPKQKNISQAEKMPSFYNQKFVSAVGGISFQNIANADSSIKVESLKINYSDENEDGKRIDLLINDKKVKVTINDWQLIPIANFANDIYTSCFTYFGELEDKKIEKTTLENGGHVLNYHKAFSNTLLGWRLADMDMLILYDFTTDLPKKNGKYILGAGETKPDLESNKKGAYKFSNFINSIENTYKYRFQSYVITDYPRLTEFTIENDSLVINGFPYYYCWQYKYQEAGFDINEVADSISNMYMTLIAQKQKNSANHKIADLLIDSLISVSYKYEKEYQFYETGTFIELIAIDNIKNKREFLKKYSIESLANMLIQVCAEMESRSPIYLKDFSDQMSAFPQLINDFNPAVWNATVNTMRFSAFFRYVKSYFPEEWDTFYSQVRNLKTVPEVKTPTIIYETGNTIITKALTK